MNVRITKAELDAFVEFSSPGGLGCLVENLTLTGVAIDISKLETTSKDGTRWVLVTASPTDNSDDWLEQQKCTSEELAKVEDDILYLEKRKEDHILLKKTEVYSGLLTQAFQNIAADGKLRGLRSLTFDIVVLREDAVTETPSIDGGDWRIVWVSILHTVIS
jgi:hypothetical protein